MTQEDILEMAREAGFEQLGPEIEDWICYTHQIERFACLVAAAERTAVLNEVADMVASCDSRATPKGIAAAIRALGNA